jgi:hypothetical protein
MILFALTALLTVLASRRDRAGRRDAERWAATR